MATATERSKGTGRGATRASRSNSNGSGSSSRRGRGSQSAKARGRAASSASRGRSTSSRSNAGGKARGASAKPANRAPAGARSNNGRGGPSNGSRGNGADIAKQVGIPAATGTVSAALGLAGGVILGRTAAARKPKKLLGVKLPTQQKADLSGLSQLAKSVNDAGRQFGKLAGEVKQARQKAEEIGRALS